MRDYRQRLHMLFARPIVAEEESDIIKLTRSSIKVPLPSLGQQDDYTCACGALRPIFKYWGIGPNPDEEAAYKRGLHADPKDGTPPYELVKFARRWGLKVEAANNMTIDDLIGYLDRRIPIVCAIQAWGSPRLYKQRRSGHYVTVIGYDKHRLAIHDPAIQHNRGYRTFDDFDSHWYDEEPDGTNYDHWGMAVWLPHSKPKATSPLRRARRIE